MPYTKEMEYLVKKAWRDWQHYVDTEEHIWFNRFDLWFEVNLRVNGILLTKQQVEYEVNDKDVDMLFQIFAKQIQMAFENYKSEGEENEKKRNIQ